jgi:alpha,alpha-trehalose phosphorylase
MIQHPAFAVEPWRIRETALDLDVLAQSESIFALSNGHLGVRGNLDEGEPCGLSGTYLNSFYDLRPIAYGEAIYGNPESSQTVINVTNGKLIRLLVDDEPFDVRYGKLRAHERILDLRAGTLERRAEWISPAGGAVRVSSVRLVSLARRAIAAISYEVESLEAPARLVVQSELMANEPQSTNLSNRDPRAPAVFHAALRSEDHGCQGLLGWLVHCTTLSGLRIAAAMDHFVDGPPGTEASCVSSPDLTQLTIATSLQPGQRLRLVKLLAYGWSSRRSWRALRDQVAAALTAARGAGWEGLRAEQRAYLDDYWQHADVELARAARTARSPPKGSPAPATTVTPSGTQKPSCSLCSRMCSRRLSPRRCAGGRQRCQPRVNAPICSGYVEPHSHGEPSTGASPPRTGPPA